MLWFSELGWDWNDQESFTHISSVGYRRGSLFQYLDQPLYSMVTLFQVCKYGRYHFFLDLELAQHNFYIVLVRESHKVRPHAKEGKCTWPLDGLDGRYISGWEELEISVYRQSTQNTYIFIGIIFSVRNKALLVNSQNFKYYLNPVILNCELVIDRSAMYILGLLEQQLKMITDRVDLVFCFPCL